MPKYEIRSGLVIAVVGRETLFFEIEIVIDSQDSKDKSSASDQVLSFWFWSEVTHERSGKV